MHRLPFTVKGASTISYLESVLALDVVFHLFGGHVRVEVFHDPN
jgi:hypothetical protein